VGLASFSPRARVRNSERSYNLTAEDANWNPGGLGNYGTDRHRPVFRRFKYGCCGIRIHLPLLRVMSNATAVLRTSVCSGRPPAKHINAMTRTPAHPPPINAANSHQKETIGFTSYKFFEPIPACLFSRVPCRIGVVLGHAFRNLHRVRAEVLLIHNVILVDEIGHRAC